MEISDIRAFISGYVQKEAMKMANIPQAKSWGNPELLKAMFSFLAENFKSPEIYNVILYDKLKQHIDSEGTIGIEDLVDQYLTTSTNEKYKATINEMSEKWAALAPGKPAPAFTLLNINGENVSLSDFKGKYVFIDFWATWCGPCLAEIPAYTKMVKDYKGRNIVFISMSVDKEKPKWEAKVKADKFEWIQIHDPIKVNKNYLVMYIPTFTLIDPEGKIVNARCPRPSNPELRKIFDAQPGL
jgi:thiol-disulfide isomerase/thioredoxin